MNPEEFARSVNRRTFLTNSAYGIGGLLGRTLPLLPLDLHAGVERECFSAEQHHHEPALSFSTRRERPFVSMVMRERFDHFLTAAAVKIPQPQFNSVNPAISCLESA